MIRYDSSWVVFSILLGRGQKLLVSNRAIPGKVPIENNKKKYIADESN